MVNLLQISFCSNFLICRIRKSSITVSGNLDQVKGWFDLLNKETTRNTPERLTGWVQVDKPTETGCCTSTTTTTLNHWWWRFPQFTKMIRNVTVCFLFNKEVIFQVQEHKKAFACPKTLLTISFSSPFTLSDFTWCFFYPSCFLWMVFNG